jgi:metal transporter CNNM
MGDATFLFPVILLLLCSALFSGLTLGLFTLSKGHLRYKAELGDKTAERIYNVRKKGNLLLCTLILGNVTVNSILSVYIGTLTTSVAASFISTALIVIIGEILPQAIFARFAFKLASKTIPLAEFFIFIFYPVAKPLSIILDRLLGEKTPTVYTKKELEKFIEYQGGLKQSSIDNDEKKIMKGALSYSDKTAGEIMTPRAAIVAVPFEKDLSHENVDDIRESGHSRIPVYEGTLDNIVGILYVKDMVGHDLAGKSAGELARRSVIFVSPGKKLDDLLNDFKRTRNHLFVVADNDDGVVGIVTIEDVIEEIIGEEIVDEYDKFEDLQKIPLGRLEKKTI